MLSSWRFSLAASIVNTRSCSRTRFCCKAQSDLQIHASNNGREQNKKKVVIIGSGWAGLGAAHHLSNQGFDVTVLEEDNGFGGLDTVGNKGFWFPYKNIFSLVDELGIKPFTKWMPSAQYSRDGLEVEFPVFQDLPQLPTPLGPLFYSQFNRLSLVDRLTSLPLMAAVIDFDNTDTSWQKYDPITARELFKQFGFSEMLYRDIFGPLLQVGLFAPAEQCSAAATLGMLYYLSLAHQKDFDVMWCRGKVGEKIFAPWIDILKTRGCRFLDGEKVTDFILNEETGSVSEVVCGNQTYSADAVILAVGISTIQELVKHSATLSTREEFLKALNLAGIDALTAKIWLDRKVNIPNAINASAAFDDPVGWTFFDLNALHDEHKSSSTTVLQADFYYANELLPLGDEYIVSKLMSYLSNFITDLETANVTDKEIGKFPKSFTHFFPGSYKYMMHGFTSFPNLFMAGDWIITRHGSWSQERSYVTGLEAANRVVDFVGGGGGGGFAKIVPVEQDEAHIEALRTVNRRLKEFSSQLPFSNYFLQ